MFRLTRPLVSTLLAATLFVAGVTSVLSSRLLWDMQVAGLGPLVTILDAGPEEMAAIAGAFVGLVLLGLPRLWRVALVALTWPVPALLFGAGALWLHRNGSIVTVCTSVTSALCMEFLCAVCVTSLSGLVAASSAEEAPDPFLWLAWAKLGQLLAEFAVLFAASPLFSGDKPYLTAMLYTLLGTLLSIGLAVLRQRPVAVPLSLFTEAGWRSSLTTRVSWLTLNAIPGILLSEGILHVSLDLAPMPLLANVFVAIESYTLALAYLGVGSRSRVLVWCMRLLALAPVLFFAILFDLNARQDELPVALAVLFSALVALGLVPNRWSILPQAMLFAAVLFLPDSQSPLVRIVLVLLAYASAARSCFGAFVALRPARERAAEFLLFRYLGMWLGVLALLALRQAPFDPASNFRSLLAVSLAAPVLLLWVARRSQARSAVKAASGL